MDAIFVHTCNHGDNARRVFHTPWGRVRDIDTNNHCLLRHTSEPQFKAVIGSTKLQIEFVQNVGPICTVTSTRFIVFVKLFLENTDGVNALSQC